MFWGKISKNTEMFRGEISKNTDFFVEALFYSLICALRCFLYTSVWCY